MKPCELYAVCMYRHIKAIRHAKLWYFLDFRTANEVLVNTAFLKSLHTPRPLAGLFIIYGLESANMIILTITISVGKASQGKSNISTEKLKWMCI